MMYPEMRMFKTPQINNTFFLRISDLASFQRHSSLSKMLDTFVQSKLDRECRAWNSSSPSGKLRPEHLRLGERWGPLTLLSVDAWERGVFMPSGFQDSAEDSSPGRHVFASVLDSWSIAVVSIRKGSNVLHFRKFCMPLDEGIWYTAKFSDFTNPTKLYAGWSGRRFQMAIGIRNKRRVEKLSYRPSMRISTPSSGTFRIHSTHCSSFKSVLSTRIASNIWAHLKSVLVQGSFRFFDGFSHIFSGVDYVDACDESRLSSPLSGSRGGSNGNGPNSMLRRGFVSESILYMGVLRGCRS